MMTSWNSDIRPVKGVPTTGRIAELSRGRSCGTIRSNDGKNVFFHGRDLEGAKYNDLEVGGAVTFELVDDRVSGPRALRIQLARKAKRTAAPAAFNGSSPGAAE